MKKILGLLVSVLCTINVFGQTDAQLAYSSVNTVTKVGDTLIVKLQYFEGKDANNVLQSNLHCISLIFNTTTSY